MFGSMELYNIFKVFEFLYTHESKVASVSG